MLPRRSPLLEEGTRGAGGNRANWFPGGPGSKRHILSQKLERGTARDREKYLFHVRAKYGITAP